MVLDLTILDSYGATHIYYILPHFLYPGKYIKKKIYSSISRIFYVKNTHYIKKDFPLINCSAFTIFLDYLLLNL